MRRRVYFQTSHEPLVSPAQASAVKSASSAAMGEDRGSTKPSADLSSELAATAEFSPPLGERTPLPTNRDLRFPAKTWRGGWEWFTWAHDPRLDRKVAIKLVPPGLVEDKPRVERFLREARMAAKVQHANTVIIHEVDVRDGNAFLVMEFVDGQSLDKVIASRQTNGFARSHQGHPRRRRRPRRSTTWRRTSQREACEL